MKLTELPNQDPKSFEFAAFKWLVKRFARPTRRLCIGLTPEFKLVGITIDDRLIATAPDIVQLAVEVQRVGLK